MGFYITRKQIEVRLFIFILLLSCLILSGCGKIILRSKWRDHEIIIDGKYKDWGVSTDYYDERTKVVLNLANDADYMYVCLISRNREIEVKILEQGLIVWFDRDNKKNNKFGVRFPIGLKNMGMSLDDNKKRDMERDWRDQEDISGLIDRQKERLRDKDFNKRLETLEGLQERIEIIEGENAFKNRDRRLPIRKEVNKKGFNKANPMVDMQPDSSKGCPELSLDEAKKFGIEARVGRENDYFVYELKVPLLKSNEHPFAIGIKNGEPISLGIEVGKNMFPPMKGMVDGDLESGDGKSMLRSSNDLYLWATVVFQSNL